MEEQRCLNCNEAFEREQGHRCLNSPSMLETGEANRILQDIADEIDIDENELISLDIEELPELSSVCTEIFNRISDRVPDSSLSKEVSFGTNQPTDSSTISCSEKSKNDEKNFNGFIDYLTPMQFLGLPECPSMKAKEMNVRKNVNPNHTM
ncbi:hypothetical protein HNY73_009641 [Argiope bruennichi]|uniref:Uncharacterized protein n=1 Tax=Argiope bruennichi TaxID=94029 RepID=A0A8T0FAA0_ARGBR|nr:hypothetical protein HNY73_009641 [Argiope bruennichi]